MKWFLPLFTISLSMMTLAQCRTTHTQRVAVLNKAVRLLKASESARPTAGMIRLTAHRYYNHYQGRYAVVKTMTIKEQQSWDLDETERNRGKLNEFTFWVKGARVGKYYQVRVNWDDGESYTWEYLMKPHGLTIDVWAPN